MTKRDYYEVLGVERNADDAALKRAYRTLAMKYHPDRNPGDASAVQKMTELNEAYAVLCDPAKRARYDRYGHAGLEGMTQEDIFRNVDFGSLFGDLFGGGVFEQFFGGGRSSGGGRRARRGEDLRYDLEITLEEAAQGIERTIRLPRAETCAACGGTGAAQGGVVTCERCEGSGQIVTERQSGYTVFRQISACSRCGGAGRMVKETCKECRGKGVKAEEKELKVTIPKGADSGNAIKLSGEGGPGEAGARAGDLYVVIKVKKHERLERHGDDLYLQYDIGFADAALGGTVSVPGLNGELRLDVPEGTQTGSALRISDEGMPRLEGRGRGDLYVVARVVTPAKLDKKAKELLEEFGRLAEHRGAPGEEAEKGGEAEKKTRRVKAKKVKE